MNVHLLGHTKLSDNFWYGLADIQSPAKEEDGKALSLSAIRTCYSANKPSEIIEREGEKYFGTPATDGGSGTDGDRLLRHIFGSKHTSTLEHLTFTFAIEGVSRALLAQLTRHRHFSFSVQSQRYVTFASGGRAGGFEFVVPHTIAENEVALREFGEMMADMQAMYDRLRELKIPSEDARAVLPNAAATNLVMTANLRALLDFYGKRKAGRGGQKEITLLAESLRKHVAEVEPWTDAFFEKM